MNSTPATTVRAVIQRIPGAMLALVTFALGLLVPCNASAAENEQQDATRNSDLVLLSRSDFAAGSAATYRVKESTPEGVSTHLIHYRLVSGGSAGADTALERIGDLLKHGKATLRRLGQAERGGELFGLLEENGNASVGVLWVEAQSGAIHVVQVILARDTPESLDSYETRALNWRDRLAGLPP